MAGNALQMEMPQNKLHSGNFDTKFCEFWVPFLKFADRNIPRSEEEGFPVAFDFPVSYKQMVERAGVMSNS